MDRQFIPFHIMQHIDCREIITMTREKVIKKNVERLTGKILCPYFLYCMSIRLNDRIGDGIDRKLKIKSVARVTNTCSNDRVYV